MAEEAQALAAQLDEREHAPAGGGDGDRGAGREASSRPIRTSAHAAVLVVAGEGWHRGVIGIVASKLVDAFHRPAIVLSIEDDVAHGSCRSIPAFDMLAALERCAPHLMRFGGHRQAAGLTMEAARVKAFRHDINAYADEALGPDDLMPRLRIDGLLGFRDITSDVRRAPDDAGAVRHRQPASRSSRPAASRSSTGPAG